MLIARAPMRISFGGGGTDLEAYYGVHGGFVVSASIDKYFYVVVSPSESDPTQILSANYQSIQHLPLTEASSVNGNLALAEAVLGCFSLHKGVNVFLASEVPPGTGLGSSGSVAVAMIKGLSALFGQSPSKQEVAELACHIEIEKLNMPVGKQDQYASSFGGLNTYTFSSHGIEVQPIAMSRGARRRLERNLMLFFTGSSRQSSSILREQRQATQSDPKVIESLHVIKRLALETKECLERGDVNEMGRLLHAGWQHKKNLASNVSNPLIDQCYDAALGAGALGGKITGAGGGGFLMLYCPQRQQAAVTRTLSEKGLRRMDFRFENRGAQVLVQTRSLAAFRANNGTTSYGPGKRIPGGGF